jgi:hypothetical protein
MTTHIYDLSLSPNTATLSAYLTAYKPSHMKLKVSDITLSETPLQLEETFGRHEASP